MQLKTAAWFKLLGGQTDGQRDMDRDRMMITPASILFERKFG